MTKPRKPTSCASQALRYVRTVGGWIRTTDIAAHLSIPKPQVAANMTVAMDRGEVIRKTVHNGTFYRYVEPVAPVFGLGDWPPGFKPQFFESPR